MTGMAVHSTMAQTGVAGGWWLRGLGGLEGGGEAAVDGEGLTGDE